MKVISVNVGLPREVLWKGKPVLTGIFKEPVEGRVRSLNLDGDRQADLTVHGGVDKAVYAYPSEHYDYWRNFTTIRNNGNTTITAMIGCSNRIPSLNSINTQMSVRSLEMSRQIG
jgi:MOSC domain-containing protein YiiM